MCQRRKVLVTGGLGFIGRVLLRSLQDSPDIEYLDVVDDCSNSVPPESEAELGENITVQIVSVGDWTPKRDYTHIYHLASPVGPAGVLNYAGKMGPMIVADTYKMAQLALKDGARLVDISTSEVYGKEPGEVAQREDLDKIVPSNITVRLEYGVAKLASEVSLLNMARTTALQVNIIRPFNIVGPSQSGEVGFVLPRFIEQALSGKPLTVFGGGQRRTFTSVHDFVRAMEMIMESDVSGEIFNVGNPANVCSIWRLAECVVRLSGSSSPLQVIDPKVIYGDLYAEAWNKIPDITKIQSTLGWIPTESLEDIILEAIEAAR